MLHLEASDTCPVCNGHGTTHGVMCPGLCAGTGRIRVEIPVADFMRVWTNEQLREQKKAA